MKALGQTIPDFGEMVDLLSLCSLNSLGQVNKTSHLYPDWFQSKQPLMVGLTDL